MIVEVLGRQYRWFDCHFNVVFGRTGESRERDLLRSAYIDSRKNLNTSRRREFAPRDPSAVLLYEELLKNQEHVELLTATGDDTSIVSLIAVGVGLGSRLAGCGVRGDWSRNVG